VRRYHSRSRYRDSHHTRRRRSRSSTASTSSSDSAKSHNKRHTKKQRSQTSKSRSPGHDLKSPPQKPVHTKALTTSPINVSGYTKQPASPEGEEEEKQKTIGPTSRPIMMPENKMQIVSYIAPDILKKKETTDLEPVNPVQEETSQILAKTTDPETEIIKPDALMPELKGEEDKPSPVETELPVNSNDLEQPTELVKEDPLLAAVDEKQQAPENNEPVCESEPAKISTEVDPLSLQAPPPPAPHQPSPFIDSIIDSVILKSQTTSETASPLSSLNQNLNHLPINNMETSTNNNSTIFSSENNTSNNQAIIRDSAEKIQQAKSKNLSKKKREFITWQPSAEQQTDENAKSTIVACANLNDPVDGSKKVIKRPKDELKQRVKKIKSSNKPKYISEYISESQNISNNNNNNNNIGICQGHLLSNNENNSHTTSTSNNIINLISNTALSVLNVNRPGPEVAKKDKLQKEKIRLEKENYIRSQLWEEHCYTPHLTWLKGEDEKNLTSLKSEKKEDSLIVSNLKQATSVNSQLSTAPATHEKSVKQKARSSGISSENVCINKQPMVAQKAVAKSFPRRTRERENEILKRFLVEGIDREDMEFLRRAYELMEIPSSNQIYLFYYVNEAKIKYTSFFFLLNFVN
jgi:hypothetical protein